MLLLLFLSITVGVLSQEEVTPDTFDSIVDGSKSVFAMFYAPWCGHCKNFKPEYAKIAQSYSNEDSVSVISIDADKYKDLASRFGVSGYPTLKFFEKGKKSPDDYSSGRTAEDVVKFINGKTGLNAKVIEPPSPVTILTDNNFNEIALDKTKDVLVEFYAPWCGHCKKLKPVYDVVASAFQNEQNVIVAKVDATENNVISSKYEVKGYPTIKFFPRNSDDVVDYKSARTTDAFVSFLNENAGTRRNMDGSLSRSAGRFPELDTLGNKFLNNDGERDDIFGELKKECEGRDNDCKYYLKYAGKINDKGNEYVMNERDRLKKLLQSGSITKERRDNFALRMNILNGYIQGPESTMDEKQEL